MRTTSRTLCLWLPDWPVQRSRRERPELVGKPLALCVGDARTERVAACSVEARRLGIAVGMKTPDAQGLAGPGRLLLLPHRAGADRRALERLAVECERFSPVVSLEDAEEPEGLLFDVTGLAPLWGDDGEKRLAEAVAQWAGADRLDAVVAVAPTVGLALAAARFLSRDAGPPIVEPRQARALAERLPVEALRVEAAIVEGLQRLGIESIGQLLDLPRASLPSRFGAELARRLDQLLGDAPEPVESFRGEPPLVAVWDFESAVACAATLQHVRHELLCRVAQQMKRRRCGALRVLIDHRLDAADAAPVRVVLRLFRPTASARELNELATLHLDGVRFPCAVRAVRVLVGATAPIDSRQRTLFDSDQREDPHALALLINRVASRVGGDRVLRIAKRSSIDPRRAYAMTPATDAPAEAFALTTRQAAKARRLPVTMPSDAPPVEVETNQHGEPVAMQWRGRCAVVRYWGPERIETGWWRGRSVRRDAWWVELDNGARLWLHCDLRRRQWRVAGEF
ncbi:DNA polymerase Y family protein [Botrimarina mediterranea]|uniref:DNA polymerase Y family protein n=1 Tax=Botrimarina mediterranea TaxID=2528022 RepID=UPI00118A99AC|nr:DNA polymerase IV [Planctomycetes bacterium K2D]